MAEGGNKEPAVDLGTDLGFTAHSSEFKPGIIIGGKFALQRVIASGAMGIVFEAWDIFVERQVALKLMHPHLTREPDLVARFRREAQTAASIQHPNVVTIFEVGKRHDGSFYLVQELLSGGSLRKHLDAHERLHVPEALSLILPIMGGLAAAHRRGIVHRDIKPDNIVRAHSPSGEIVPKLIDFGIAKLAADGRGKPLTQAGALIGTPEYMSPEQVSGQANVDARTDIWAVAVVLFEMLAGVGPYSGPEPSSVLYKILSQPPPRLESLAADVPLALADAIHRALARAPEDRFQSMQAFREALQTPRTVDATAPAGPSSGKAPPSGVFSFDPVPIAMSEIELVEELDPELLVPEDEDDIPTEMHSRVSLPLLGSEIGASGRRGPLPQFEWRDTEVQPPPGRHDRLAEKAEHALSLNALEDAIAYADLTLQMKDDGAELKGRMRLVQAVALRWLGNYTETSRCAQEALRALPHRSMGWYAAVGHLIIAYGYLGRSDQLTAIAAELRSHEPENGQSEAQLVTACRLVVALISVGCPGLAHEIWHGAQQIAQQHGVSVPFVRAWLDAARANFAVHEGDLATYRRRAESAADNFTSASDIRNACHQRANLADAYMQLGAHERACALFREALTIAEPMQLDFITGTKANIGLTLAYLGQLDEALAKVTEALNEALKKGYRRAEGVARIYLALVRSLRNEPALALAMAQSALETTEESSPAVHAYALAVSASILLGQNRAVFALDRAQEAAAILERIEGIYEGESLIQVTYALALRGTNQEQEGRRQITRARRRLLEKAERISDPRWRQSFLENVTDNARLVHIAAQWLDEPG